MGQILSCVWRIFSSGWDSKLTDCKRDQWIIILFLCSVLSHVNEPCSRHFCIRSIFVENVAFLLVCGPQKYFWINKPKGLRKQFFSWHYIPMIRLCRITKVVKDIYILEVLIDEREKWSSHLSGQWKQFHLIHTAAPNCVDFIAQFVEHYTGIAENHGVESRWSHVNFSGVYNIRYNCL